MEDLVDLVLHPIRMRVVMALAGRQMTAQQVADALGDVPPATLYRHLNRLVEAGVVAVVSERRVRGTLEKVYTMNAQGPQLSPDQFAALSKEEHLRYFTTYVATLLDDYSRYLQHSDPRRILEDGVGYRKILLELSDEEFAAMAAAINAAVIPYLNNQPGPGRRRRILSTIVMPDVEGNDAANNHD